MTTGIILFAHGSRDPQWRLPIEAVARQISERSPSAQVRCAYLELCLPSLPDAAIDLVAVGAQKIRVFPLFLGVGKHAREDLPLLIEEIRTAHPAIEIELLATAGENRALISLMADLALA
ncbi:MAG: CbiX/SirB N-terminal domain-containing protein [Vitreoscilla sp.]|nr:CbiX/SirB N-terminal domain-containing protein [Polaromonas sp.]